MLRRRSILLLFLCALLCLLAAGCGRRAEYVGVTWQHPDDKALPQGYDDGEDVPAYVHRWRMPRGFAGFTKRWNEQVEQYLAREHETAAQRYEDSLNAFLTRLIEPEQADAALRRATEALTTLRTNARRRAEGPALVYRTESELPKDLEWQDGADEPELGSPEARRGGSLRLALQRSFPATLRPLGPNSNNPVRRYIYDDFDLPLVRIHPGTGKLIPGTADRWAVSADGRTVYYHIDGEARFSDGSKLTARDFVAALYIRTSPYLVDTYLRDSYLTNFAKVTIYGNSCIAVTLSTPRPYAPVFAGFAPVCTPFFAEFGPDYPLRYLWRAEPTTGAYTVNPAGLIMGRRITLSRVPKWWAEKRRYTRYSCNVSHIVYEFINEPSKARELFRLGEVDVLSARDADFWYEGLETDPVYRGLIQRVHFSNIWPRSGFGFYLNCSRPPFNDRRMRLGFQYALNINLVIETIFRGDYRREGSFFAGFGPYTDETLQPRPYSPDRARACFAEAGYTIEGPDGILCRPDGTRLQVTVSSKIDPLYTKCLGMLREEAARCGLDLRSEQTDDTIFNSRVKDKQYAAAIFAWGMSPPLPNPEPFFGSAYAYREDGTPLPGTCNITATADPELDDAITAARNAATEEEAIAAHHRVQQLIHKSAAWVPGWSTNYWRFAQWRWVRWPDTPECRFCPPRYYDPLDSHLYWIDSELKEEVLKRRSSGGSFPESEIDIPLPKQP